MVLVSGKKVVVGGEPLRNKAQELLMNGRDVEVDWGRGGAKGSVRFSNKDFDGFSFACSLAITSLLSERVVPINGERVLEVECMGIETRPWFAISSRRPAMWIGAPKIGVICLKP